MIIRNTLSDTLLHKNSKARYMRRNFQLDGSFDTQTCTNLPRVAPIKENNRTSASICILWYLTLTLP